MLDATLYCNLAEIETDHTSAFTHLLKALKITNIITSLYEKVTLLMSIAARSKSKDMDDQWLEFRYDTLNLALSLAVEGGFTRLISLAAGKMGTLYERHGKFKDALTLSEQAFGAAQIIGAHELLLQWDGSGEEFYEFRDTEKKLLQHSSVPYTTFRRFVRISSLIIVMAATLFGKHFRPSILALQICFFPNPEVKIMAMLNKSCSKKPSESVLFYS